MQTRSKFKRSILTVFFSFLPFTGYATYYCPPASIVYAVCVNGKYQLSLKIPSPWKVSSKFVDTLKKCGPADIAPASFSDAESHPNSPHAECTYTETSEDDRLEFAVNITTQKYTYTYVPKNNWEEVFGPGEKFQSCSGGLKHDTSLCPFKLSD